ncbi:MAG: ABC transporter ATP-binding protein/permease [Myxococcales bacterium]|nr:ABC transporter ATP-binding protein/permease [Myxococcales bacterium]MDH5305720.1 ABC transporter ATP-binding protein/permease [Myxococcales bacterium]MDH5565107.1 ABC transporter ATP-binding protein/permease [Myxococcales bacterium]
MRLLRYFLRAYPWQSLVVLACLLVAALTEGIGLSALLPLLSLATGSGADGAVRAAPSAYEQWVRAELAEIGVEPTLGVLLALIATAFWLKGMLLLLSKKQVGYTVARVATDLRLNLLQALLTARWRFYTRQPMGAVANSMATEADRASEAYRHLALIASYGVEAVLYAGIALAISWRATLAAGLGALFTVSVLHALVRMSGRAGRKQTRLLKSLLERLTDALQAVKLLKATGREASIGPLLAEDTRKLNRQLERRVLSQEALRALQEPILVSLMCAGAFVALVVLAMPFSSVMVLIVIVTRTLTRVNSMQSKYQSMVTEASALWSLSELIDRARQEREPLGGSVAPHLDRAIEFKKVSVRYEDRPVLDEVSLELPAGRITAIVGPSGAGKTTFVDLITGLLKPDSGQVVIDGVPLDAFDLHRWREGIGYVPQEILLLHDCIRTNVTLGDPNVTDAQVEQALRSAGAWEFVANLPDGIRASVGERGALLSSGQRQRIAIARALVHRPRLLILDEATAALDAANEAAIWASVERLRGATTVVAISHQPSLAKIADRVVRIDDGRAVETAPERPARAPSQEVA